MEFNPRIIAFLCNWCSSTEADLAGTSRVQYKPNVLAIRVMCSGRLKPLFGLKTFRQGAGEILIYVCLPGDGQYCIFVSKSWASLIKFNETMTTLSRYLTANQIGTGLERKLNASKVLEFDAIFLFAGIEFPVWTILSGPRLPTTSDGISISDMAPANIDYQKNFELLY